MTTASSCVFRCGIRVAAHYDPDASVARLAAVLGWGLLKDHAFLDRNKRVSFASINFLKLNG